MPWLFLATTVGMALGCSEQRQAPREIRGHTLLFNQIPHGVPAARGQRYCSYCHGQSLQGGREFEPSCYTCHGKNWRDSSSLVSLAPADHTESFSGFRHHPHLNSNVKTCEECHGEDLKGVFSSGLNRPNCLLCHGPLWDSGVAPVP
jgi:hypothetical protein